MNLAQLELVRQSSERIVSEAMLRFEGKNGRFKVEAIREEISGLFLSLLLLVTERVESGEFVSVVPIKQSLLEILLVTELKPDLISGVLNEIFSGIEKELETLPGFSLELLKTFKLYFSLVEEVIFSGDLLSSSSGLDIVQSVSEYQYLESSYSFDIRDVDIATKTVYTLFNKERYFDPKRNDIKIVRNDVIIFEDRLYKLAPEVVYPTREKFVSSEWVEYSSKILDKSKCFTCALQENTRSFYESFLDLGSDINQTISDSKISNYRNISNLPEKLLPKTFGGEGKQILSSARRLKLTSDSFGGYQGSVAGNFAYVTEFMGYFISTLYGRNDRYDYDIVDGRSSFGRFDLIFVAKIEEDRIPGLLFLGAFNKLKSFAHNKRIGKLDTSVGVPRRVICNVAYNTFRNGVKDRYIPFSSSNSYVGERKVNIPLYALESAYGNCLTVGDNLLAIYNSLSREGQLPGIEGLGSIRPQIEELQNVFPPSSVIGSRTTSSLTEGLGILLDGYRKLSDLLIYPEFPASTLDVLLNSVSLITNELESLLLSIGKTGIMTGSFVPNLSFTRFDLKNSDLVEFFTSLGLRDSEIEQLIDVSSFEELVTRFAPLSDSSDLKSFFKAYELTQMIYEFGGEAAVNAYLDFLYSGNSVDSLINLLSISEISKSKFTSVQIRKYPRLIGLLLGLTYAVDPNQLVRFNKILGKNNLNLLESISYLLQSGQSTIIKSRDNIDLLTPMVDQIAGNNRKGSALLTSDMDYEQANRTSPIALRKWTRIIGRNLGSISSKNIIHHLYDKSIGLTPDELVTILGNPVSLNEFGELVDGIRGGKFTTFLRYASVSGLAVKLGYYGNSYQVDNFYSGDKFNYLSLTSLIDGIDSLVRRLDLVKTALESGLNFGSKDDGNASNITEVLKFAQNKESSTLAEIVKAIVPVENDLQSRQLEENISFYRALAGNAPVTEAPGIGNSRVPNRIPVVNSLTPEQASILLGSVINSEITSRTTSSAEKTEVGIDRFIKFSAGNKLINGIDLPDETVALEASRSSVKTLTSSLPGYDRVTPSSPVSSIPYRPSKISSDPESGGRFVTQGPGINFISKDYYALSDEQLPTGITPPVYDPVESCKRFGGTECDSIYESVPQRCPDTFNRSNFPEYYSSVPGVNANSVIIDRPLGTFPEYRPSLELIPISLYSSPPRYLSVLPAGTSVGRRGEPLLPEITTLILPASGGGEVSEFGNTEFGVVEFLRGGLERSTEFNCATLESPFHYQMCMNVMKCKRFSPGSGEDYYLDFCPKTLAGGRLR